MNFRLERKAAGAALTKFNVTDGKGTIYGLVSVPNAAARDLEKCWRDSAPAARTGDKKPAVGPTRCSRLLSGHRGGTRKRSCEAAKGPWAPVCQR